MISLSLLSLGIVILLAAMTVLSVVATHSNVLQPAVVNPFGGTSFDPASETLPTGVHCENTLDGDWKSVELSRLSDVEDLLDSLEANAVRRTELELAGNDRFTVRWR